MKTKKRYFAYCMKMNVSLTLSNYHVGTNIIMTQPEVEWITQQYRSES